MTGPAGPAPVPVPDPETAAFWEACAGGRFELCRCQECRRWLHPPLERCRSCAGPTAFEPAGGRGQVFSYIVVRHPAVPGRALPYVIAVVELDDQPGLRITGVVDADPDLVGVGAPVVVRISPVGDGTYRAPAFELT